MSNSALSTTVIQTDGIMLAIAPHVRIPKEEVQAGLIARMGVNAFALYVALAAHAGKDQLCWPTVLRLAGLIGLCRSVTVEAMAVLVEGEWVQRVGSKGGRSTVYLVGPTTSTWSPGRPARGRQGGHRKSIKERISRKKQANDLPLFGPAPAQPNADAAAFLLRLGMDGRWVARVGHTWTLARCEEARTYACLHAKKGGFLGYLRTVLEKNYPDKALPAEISPSDARTPVPIDSSSATVALAMPDVASVMREEAQERADHAKWCAENRKRILFAKG